MRTRIFGLNVGPNRQARKIQNINLCTVFNHYLASEGEIKKIKLVRKMRGYGSQIFLSLMNHFISRKSKELES